MRQRKCYSLTILYIEFVKRQRVLGCLVLTQAAVETGQVLGRACWSELGLKTGPVAVQSLAL